MKKIWHLILLVSFINISTSHAQTINRTTKKPNFFIHEQALTTSSQPEQLPPVASMNHKGSYVLIKVDYKLPDDWFNHKHITPEDNEVKQPTENTINENKKTTEEKNIPTTKTPSTIKTENNTPNITSKQKFTPMQTSQHSEDLHKEQISTTTKSEESNNIFSDIFVSYEIDLKAIKNGKDVENPRLKQVISEFINKDIPIN